MINRVYGLTVPEERLPPDSETKPTGRPVPSDLPVQAVQRSPGIRQFVEEETSRVTGLSRTPGRRYLRREPGGELVLMLSIPLSEEEMCDRLEAAGARFLHEEPSMPFNSDGTLTIPYTFQELALGNTVDADFVRRNAGVRRRLARALDRAAEAMPKDALEVTRWTSVDQDPENGSILVTWSANPPGQPRGPGGGRDHPSLTVGWLLELLAQLPPDIPVQAEGCDCVNDIKGVGLYQLGPYNREGPRCILVTDPDFYGVLAPSLDERQRRAYLEERQRRREAEQWEGQGPKGNA